MYKKIKAAIEKPIRQKFNEDVLDATYKAQKKYGFKIGTGVNRSALPSRLYL